MPLLFFLLGPMFFWLALTFFFLVFLNPSIGLRYLLLIIFWIAPRRIPNLELTNLDLTAAPITQYNGLVFLLSIILLIYFLVGAFSFIINLKLTILNKYTTLITKTNLVLSVILNYGLIFILFFSIYMYNYYSISDEFCDKAAGLYSLLYQKDPLVIPTLTGLCADHLIYILLSMAKVLVNYYRTYYLINRLNLISLKFNVKSFRLAANSDLVQFLKGVFVLFVMILYSHLTIMYLFSNLSLVPLRAVPNYTLHALAELNSKILFCLIVALLTIRLTDYLVKLINELKDNSEYYYRVFTLRVIHEYSLFNEGKLNVLIAFVKLTNTLGYYAVFACGLMLYTHHIPGGFLAIGYKV